MPYMISLRTFTLATKLGHTVGFEAKKPSYVPPSVVSEALAAGCVMVDETDAPFFDDLTKAKVDFVGDMRHSLIYLAIERLAARNKPHDFDGAGNPKAGLIVDMLGFDVLPAEVVPIWQQYLSLKQDGKEYPLHPDAKKVQRVLEITRKADLVALADEIGVEAEKAEGLTSRELRKLLLVKLSGVTLE